MSGGPPGCPGCLADVGSRRVGTHRDPIEGRDYALLRCPACGLTYSEPRSAPGADFYRRVHSGETRAQASDWRHRTFFETFPSPGRLLDVGCGEGTFLLEARGRGWKTAGIDFNEDYVAAARRSGLEDVEASELFTALERRRGAFDAAALFDVLEHVPEPGRLLEALRGTLVPGGYLAVAVPDGSRPLLGEGSRERFDFPPYHFTRWTEESLRRALERAGFTPVLFRHSPLHFGFFAGQLCYRTLYALFPLLKRLLAGARAGEEGKTFTDLYSEGKGGKTLADPARRQRLVDAAYLCARVLLFPLDAFLVLAFRLLAPERGRTLFALAKNP